LGLDKVDKVPEEGALGPHLKPERLPHTEIGVQVEV